MSDSDRNIFADAIKRLDAAGQHADSDPEAIEPDIPLGLKAEEFFAGDDPVLERALSTESK